MSELRQILVVDEQKATVDFLRSVLTLVEGDPFDVLRVLSAEEGLLELRRRPYDLVIAGLRLPGMDGLELARRVRRLRPAPPIILVSARPLPELREQAAALGVQHFLQKPLDAEEFLAAFEAALAAAPPPAPPSAAEEAEETEAGLPGSIVERLQTLCAETGAGQVLLATVGGELLHTAGSQLHPDVPRLVAATSASVNCSIYLSDQLDEQDPQAIQFLQGQHCDLYWANVGREHFIAILFDAQIRRGRIGTVWVFARRAVADLAPQLKELSDETGLVQPIDEGPGSPDVPAAAEVATDEAHETPADPEVKSPKATSASPDQAEDDTSQTPPSADLASDINLDEFWDQALANEGGAESFTAGISLEEAKKKGLLSEDFDPEDQKTSDG